MPLAADFIRRTDPKTGQGHDAAHDGYSFSLEPADFFFCPAGISESSDRAVRAHHAVARRA